MNVGASRLVSVLLLLSAKAALAGLSSESHPDFGPGSLTKDSAQGLYWLTPNATVGLSFVGVTALLATDPRFGGFRVASLPELERLYVEAGIPHINVPGHGALYGTPENVPGVQFLQSLTGTTYSVHVAGQRVTETAGFVGQAFTSPVNGFLSIALGDVTLRQDVPTTAGPVMDFASASTAWSSLPVGS